MLVEGGQEVGAEVAGIGVDGDQLDPAGVGAEDPVGHPELLGDDRAVRGAHRVQEGEGDGLAVQAGQGDGLAVLVDEIEGRGGAVGRGGGAVDGLGEDRVGVAVGGGHGHGGGADQGDPDGAQGGDERKA